MGIRYAGMVAGVICVSGCQGQALEVGTNGATIGSTSGGSTGASSGGTTALSYAICDGGISDGAGFVALRPTECWSVPGTTHTVTSASDIASLLVGDWFACGQDIVPWSTGIQFTADGRFTTLTSSADDSLVAVGSPAAVSGATGFSGSTTGPVMSSPGGRFSVVDGSSTYGPGTFELHLNPDNGGIFEGEITITDSPRAFSFQAPNDEAVLYAPAAPWTPRANVCSACSDSSPGGNPIDENDANALSTDIVGRWVWCAGSTPGWTNAQLGLGMEFTADGTWYSLAEAEDGTLSRSIDPQSYGTFAFSPNTGNTGPLGYVGPEPLDLQLTTQQGQVDIAQVVVTQNPTGIWLTAGFSSGTVGPQTLLYSYLSPLP